MGLSWVDVAAAALLLAASVGLLAAAWAWDLRFKDEAQAVQALVTTAAIVVGGFFALRRFQAFRTFEPHLTITHDIAHRSVGSHYVHIAVTATLHNTSRVHVAPQDGIFSLQKVSPVSDEEVERLYAQVFEDREHRNVQWPTIDEVFRTWYESKLVVEPGEKHHETVEFIVSDDIETIVAYTYFYNPRYRASSGSAEGWSAATVYDIVDRR